jgi:hypothetical protein
MSRVAILVSLFQFSLDTAEILHTASIHRHTPTFALTQEFRLAVSDKLHFRLREISKKRVRLFHLIFLPDPKRPHTILGPSRATAI